LTVAWRASAQRAVRFCFQFGAACSGLLCASAFAADHYSLDVVHSIPEFEFKHLGVTTQTGRFDKARGTVVLDRAARSGSVTYEVDTASLNMGFGTESPDSPGYQLFEVVKFPKIIFLSNKLLFNQKGEVIGARGRLTILGVTNPLTIAVNHFTCAVNPLLKKEMCAGEIKATIKRSQFGMVKYIPGISDEIDIIVPIEAYKD
jgi:polyisoprenoid-binding protein YceI